MTGGIPLARRNLLRQRLRFTLSVSGIGLALLMTLSLDAIYSALLRQVTAYPDNVGAPVIVSQRGVETMHMSSSALPPNIVERLRGDRRVARAAPILYVSMVLGKRQQAYSYLIGFRGAGGPWRMAAGDRSPKGAAIVVDERTAARLGLGLGSQVSVAGRRLRVVGLARNTASVVSSVSFIDFRAFSRIFRVHGAASYVLVWPRRGYSAGGLVAALRRAYPDITAQTREDFSKHERQVVSDMSTGLIRGMALIGLIVGVAVAGLSIYTATTARLREYAVLKAIGMGNRKLYGMISRQVLITVGTGLALALVLLVALSEAIPRVEPSVSMVVTPDALVQASVITVVIGVLAALLPARRVARVDPASVYRSQ